MTTRVTPNSASWPAAADAQSAWSCARPPADDGQYGPGRECGSTRPPRLADIDCGDPFDDLFVVVDALHAVTPARADLGVHPRSGPGGWHDQIEANPRARHSVVDLLRGAAANWGRGGRSPVMWKLRVVANTGGGSLPADSS